MKRLDIFFSNQEFDLSSLVGVSTLAHVSVAVCIVHHESFRLLRDAAKQKKPRVRGRDPAALELL